MASPPTPSSIELRPGTTPPPGIKANFVNPPSRAWEVYVASGICLPLMLIFATMRFYAAVFLSKTRSKSDYACIVGLAAGITYIGITVGAVSGGVLGKHHWDFLVGQWTEEGLRLSLVNEAIYGPLIWFIKFTVFVLLLEIFGCLRWLRLLIWFGIVATGLFYYAHMIVLLATCAPRGEHTQLAYIEILSTPKCETNLGFILPVGIMNVVSDVYLMLIPLPAVWRLQLPLIKKVGISAIFLTGFTAVICSILGTKYRLDEAYSHDNTWTIISLYNVTIVETAAGVIVSCMPATVAICRHCVRRKSRLPNQMDSSGRPMELTPARNDSQVRLKQDDFTEDV